MELCITLSGESEIDVSVDLIVRDITTDGMSKLINLL